MLLSARIEKNLVARSRRVWIAGLLVATLGLGLSEEARADKAAPKLHLTVDKQKVDLAKGRLEVRLSRAAARVTLKVVGQSGAVVAEVSQTFDAAPAGSPLLVTWAVKPKDPVARIEIYGYDVDGYYTGVAITPWSLLIPHRDILFATGSAKILDSEGGKLKQSLSRIVELLKRHGSLGSLTLYVVAHTDTVGTAEYNRRLSTRRARAIAGWFRAHGLRIPIAFDGLGEAALKVATPDGVPEPRNRRVDYSLGLEPPRFKKSGTSPSWRKL